jgi:hypothetical protein
MKTYEGVNVETNILLISSLGGSEWSASRSDSFTSQENPGTNCIGGWVGPRAGLADVEKRTFFNTPGLELRPLGRPTRRQSLYRLSPVNKTTDSFMVYLTTLRVAVVMYYFVTCIEVLRNIMRILNQDSQSPGRIGPRSFQPRGWHATYL